MHKTHRQQGFGLVEIIILVVIIAALGAGGWYVWQAQTTKNQAATSPSTTNSSQSTSQNVFKIPELGVEFDVAGGITPLYKVVDQSWNGVNYKSLQLSTQQLVNKGAASGGAVNPCVFPGTGNGLSYQALVARSYSTFADRFKIESERNSNLTESSMTPQNGYLTIGNRYYYVQSAGAIESGQGDCLNDAGEFENQQRTLLHDSLITLRATK